LGRTQKPSGRVELNNEGSGAIGVRTLDTLSDKVIDGGIDAPIDDDQVHVGWRGAFRLSQNRKARKEKG
jgi:hypothetical protein